jgi:radical SAM protein with 4Fe4S-binding SPASM domain
MSEFVNAKNLYSRKLIGRVVRENRQLIPCYAGSLAGVMLANGDVYPCELLEEPMGNVREHEYRIDRLWTSERAAQVRKAVDGCFCTHECFISVNCLFNPRILAKLTKDVGLLKLKRTRGAGGA